jgi:uncharacterized protein DUF6508
MTGIRFSEVADRFCNMLYDAGWILPDFDWATWSRHSEGRKLLENREAIAAADCEQLAKPVTALARQDRFVEGTLARAYENGALLAIVERAEVLWTA